MDNLDVLVLDYGLGNSNSIASCLREVGCYTAITSDKAMLENAKVIFIPGVGSFQQGVKNMKDRGLFQFLQDLHKENNCYFIGVCLGMQLFASSSVEGGKCEGFNWIEGEVLSLKDIVKEHSLPHIGWNSIEIENSEQEFLRGLDGESFYYDHEYYFSASDQYVEASCNYGARIPSIIANDKVIGFQFHPEKSQISGKKLLIQTLSSIGVNRRPVWIESV